MPPIMPVPWFNDPSSLLYQMVVILAILGASTIVWKLIILPDLRHMIQDALQHRRVDRLFDPEEEARDG